MNTSSRHSGASLVELIVTLAILSIVAAVAVPGLNEARDAWGARAACDAVTASITHARALGIARGSARLLLDPVRSIVALESPAGTAAREPVQLRAEYGVTLVVDRSTSLLAIDFDGLGLGRLANRTVRCRRGTSEARVSLSTYGRPRRW